MEARKARVEHERDLHKNRVIASIALVVCAVLLLTVLLNGEMAVRARKWTINAVSIAGDWLMEGRPFTVQMEEIGAPARFHFLIEAAILALRTCMGFVMVVLGFCVAICSKPIGWLVWLLIYALPALGAICSIAGLFDWYGRPEASDYETGEDDILRAGLEGEKKALEVLALGLDSQCHVFANLLVPYADEKSETDLIAVTPAGVTIIEVKNHKRIIMGDLSDHDFIQRRELRSGKYEDATFYNPVRQVGTHVYRLAGYLREHNVPVHVDGCVLFTNDEVRLHLTDREGISHEKCPVFHISEVQRLCKTLDSGRRQLDGEQMAAVVKALDRLTGRRDAPLDAEDYDLY